MSASSFGRTKSAHLNSGRQRALNALDAYSCIPGPTPLRYVYRCMSRSHRHRRRRPSARPQSPRHPRSYTPLSDALRQPLTFADTELAEGLRRHRLPGCWPAPWAAHAAAARSRWPTCSAPCWSGHCCRPSPSTASVPSCARFSKARSVCFTTSWAGRTSTGAAYWANWLARSTGPMNWGPVPSARSSSMTPVRRALDAKWRAP
jgi:hypothetical protein